MHTCKWLYIYFSNICLCEITLKLLWTIWHVKHTPIYLTLGIDGHTQGGVWELPRHRTQGTVFGPVHRHCPGADVYTARRHGGGSGWPRQGGYFVLIDGEMPPNSVQIPLGWLHRWMVQIEAHGMRGDLASDSELHSLDSDWVTSGRLLNFPVPLIPHF